jgi:hypothetical protein
VSNLPRGVAAETLRNGIRYAVIHYSADEDKGPAWRDQQHIGVTNREWDREMELQEDVHEGEPVFPMYVDSYHCPIRYRETGIPLVDGSTYYGGTDAGTTLNPAFVLLQVTPRPHCQIHALLEVTSMGSEPMSLFAPRVMMAVRRRLPGAWADVRVGGDQTIGTHNGATGQTSQQIAASAGLHIELCSNDIPPRLAAVEWALMRQVGNGSPGFLLDPRLPMTGDPRHQADGCPILREGFQGAYKLRTSASGEVSGPGAAFMLPLKNSYSNVHDALQYALLLVQTDIQELGAKMLL